MLDVSVLNKNTFLIHFDINVSVNSYIVKAKNVFNKYKNLILSLSKCKECLRCRKYIFYYVFFFKDNKRRDVSNYIKFFEDLVFYLIDDDDSKVDMIFIKKIINESDKNSVLIYYECV